MDNIKTDRYYLDKITLGVEFIIKHTKDMSKEAFEENELLQDSMMFRLIQISENVAKLSDDFREANKNIPWYEIKGLRNRIVHDYGSVDMSIIFETITNDIPKVNELLKNIN